jgi:hypothetical protein
MMSAVCMVAAQQQEVLHQALEELLSGVLRRARQLLLLGWLCWCWSIRAVWAARQQPAAQSCASWASTGEPSGAMLQHLLWS